MDKGNVFGAVKKQKMYLNKFGVVVENKIQAIKNHFLGVDVVDYVIMPNHVHLLIWVKLNSTVGNAYMRSQSIQKSDRNKVEGKYVCGRNSWEANGNYLGRNAYMRSVLPENRSKMLIPKVIQNFKAAVSREIGIKIWQKSFYDEVIRNKKMMDRIRKYIKSNPANWIRDINNLNL